ncbi:hypothetical protein AYI68_g2903 [Smittium mucronatum]|uniref:Uncharacterized protein n=1 Tax=Smittium mucronatum TaxID=133383 RepID=A0A1R0H1F6_9FUNG|nr:hypothetical protein AYI68_g2903 [Smittium mucronatum]
MNLSLLKLTVSLVLGNGIIYCRGFVEGFYSPEDSESSKFYGGNKRFGQYYGPSYQSEFYPGNIRQTQSGPEYFQNWNPVQKQVHFGQQISVQQHYSRPVANQNGYPKKIGEMDQSEEFGTKDSFYKEDGSDHNPINKEKRQQNIIGNKLNPKNIAINRGVINPRITNMSKIKQNPDVTEKSLGELFEKIYGSFEDLGYFLSNKMCFINSAYNDFKFGDLRSNTKKLHNNIIEAEEIFGSLLSKFIYNTEESKTISEALGAIISAHYEITNLIPKYENAPDSYSDIDLDQSDEDRVNNCAVYFEVFKFGKHGKLNSRNDIIKLAIYESERVKKLLFSTTNKVRKAEQILLSKFTPNK